MLTFLCTLRDITGLVIERRAGMLRDQPSTLMAYANTMNVASRAPAPSGKSKIFILYPVALNNSGASSCVQYSADPLRVPERSTDRNCGTISPPKFHNENNRNART